MMHGDVLLVVLVLIFGCAAFFFGVFYLAGRLVVWVARGLVGLMKPGRGIAAKENNGRPPGGRGSCRATRWGTEKVNGRPLGGRGSGRARVCPCPECRNIETRVEAIHCGQCGTRLK